jgi:hypothetical protein
MIMEEQYKLYLVINSTTVQLAVQNSDTHLLTREEVDFALDQFRQVLNLCVETVTGDMIAIPAAKMRDCYFIASVN